METDRLRYFCTVVDSGSLSKASEILNISHSGLSKSLTLLGQDVNRKLFRPRGRGLELTADGTWLYSKAKELLAIAHEIQTGVLQESGSLRIAMSEAMAVSCCAEIAKVVTVPLIFEEAPYGAIEKLLVANQVDFGIAFVPAPRSELEHSLIGRVSVNSIARTDLLSQVSLEDLQYIAPSEDFKPNVMGYKARDGWPSSIPRSIRYSVSSFSIGFSLVKAGLGAAYFPDFVAEAENRARATTQKLIRVEGHEKAGTYRNLYLIKNRSSRTTDSMREVVEKVRELCCSTEPT